MFPLDCCGLRKEADQHERRMAELRDEFAVIESETVSPDEVQRAIALFDPIWDMLFPRERSRVVGGGCRTPCGSCTSAIERPPD